VYAISDSPNNFRVHLAGWDGNTIWTSDASSGGLNETVPSSVLTGQIYDIVLEKEDGIAISCEPDEGDPIKNRRQGPGPYKVAIFLPNGSFEKNDVLVPTSDCRRRAVAELMQWCDLKHMNYVILYRQECTWEIFAEVLSQSSLKYVYMVGHGSGHLGTGPNTVNRLNFVVSAPDLGYWGIETVVSRKGGLPGNMDSDPRVHSMEELGLYNWDYIKLVYMTVCHQGDSDEMARKWINYDFAGVPLGQLFCGWSGCPGGIDPDWKNWDYEFWHRWGSGEVTASKVIADLKEEFPIRIWIYFETLKGWTQMRFTP
jgi:hypothetical protein